jgi:hypothetical protein
VCGAFGARRLALSHVKQTRHRAAFVQLAWSPGDMSPSFGTLTTYDSLGNAFRKSLTDEQLAGMSIKNLQSCIPHAPRPQLLRKGYFLQLYD